MLHTKTSRDLRYDILFEPMAIGPVRAKNRFYQVPHCNGGGYRDPSAVAEMRRVKAEGGWGVIFTEQVEMHHSSDITPYIELRLWDDKDIPILAKIADNIHQYNALAGVELTYSGINGPNLYSREVPMSSSAGPILTFSNDPVSARSMDKEDIKDLRRWHRNACLRSKQAGYDIICFYAAHGFGIIQHFLSSATNQRNDEYGGSLYNRSRLMRELIAEARDAVGDSMAIALRLSLDEMFGNKGFSNSELRECIEMNSDIPDLWDLAHGAWEDCSATSRFKEEGAQEDLIAGIKQLTDRPIVGVGRFTSPDTMVRHIKNNIIDFIGCARPSIADPFLPNKINENRFDDIRECIGCNICVSGDMTMSIARCTQNPSFMEEWRKGWHPETIESKGHSQNVLIIGAGPAGLEAAHALGLRGYDVVVAETKDCAGGRVENERHLPGLSAWGRVADYRLGQINKLPNVQLYLQSELNVDQVLEFGFEHVAIATGSYWLRNGVGRYHLHPIPIQSKMALFTPDDLIQKDSTFPQGHIVVYDDDHYYMASVISELLVSKGCSVSFVTPATCVSQWSLNTLEQAKIQSRLIAIGVNIYTSTSIEEIAHDHVKSGCIYSDKVSEIQADGVVMVTARYGNDQLWTLLKKRNHEWSEFGVQSIKLIGDAQSPAPIAWATYAGHRYARELDAPAIGDDLPFKRDVSTYKV